MLTLDSPDSESENETHAAVLIFIKQHAIIKNTHLWKQKLFMAGLEMPILYASNLFVPDSLPKCGQAFLITYWHTTALHQLVRQTITTNMCKN